MQNYQQLKNDLIEICRALSSWIKDAGALPGLSEDALLEWQQACDEIEKQLATEIIRVAVVGAIKSGKSTFVNSLFMGDYLMRGAGVITSIVTRIRSGSGLAATLFLKSWDQINTEIAGALILFPSLNDLVTKDRFDIRREQDRSALEKALSDLSTDHWITNDTRNINSVILTSYLKGYETVKDIIGNDTEPRRYENELFPDHRMFAGNDSLAVYLRDIELEINTGNFDPNIEIADCQGSDSSNPLHLTMIQDYLLRTHFIVYVISSRTGLRQGDIKFLTMIKKMGILDNILFVVNCDFSEHESAEGLNQLIDRVKEELSLIKTDPEVYKLSALYNLFKAQKNRLPQREQGRFNQWEEETRMVSVSDRDTDRFDTAFRKKVTDERTALLLINNLERLNVLVSAMAHWLRLQQEIFTRDTESSAEIIDKIKHHQKRITGIKSMIKSTLDGAVQTLKDELKAEIDQYFDSRYGEIVSETIELIRDYKVSTSEFRDRLETTGFTHALYMVYQEFKQTLDTFMAETVNPRMIQFIRTVESRIKQQLSSIAAPFDAMTKDALMEYNSSMSKFGISISNTIRQPIDLPDMDAIRTIAGLSLPPAAAVMQYTARIRTEATLRFGFYSVAKILKRILKKPIQNQNEEAILALRDGILRMKKETEKSVISHFKDYKENIKFQYVFRLVDAVSNTINKTLNDQFQACGADLSKMIQQATNQQVDWQQLVASLQTMAETTGRLDEKIQTVRIQITG